jgi:hypothetical protein
VTLWTDRQFWLDATWRAFRTFCQTLAALLAAQFSGLLQAGGPVSGALPHTPWVGLLYASAIAALISLLQSVDRGRAVGSVATQVVAAQAALTPAAPVTVTTVSAVVPADVGEVVTTCGDAPLR